MFLILSGHLHLGNVFIEDGSVRLSDIENFTLGVPPYYRTFATYHKKCDVSIYYTTHLANVISGGLT